MRVYMCVRLLFSMNELMNVEKMYSSYYTFIIACIEATTEIRQKKSSFVVSFFILFFLFLWHFALGTVPCDS
jgi:hypothetical protein